MKTLSMVIVGLGLLAGSALAWNPEDTKFALHRKDAPQDASTICTSYSPVAEGLPCVAYNTVGPAPGYSLVYFVVGFGPDVGIDGVILGIDYSGRAGQGVGIDPDDNTFTFCGDGLPFTSDGGFGEFPAPMGGLSATWTTCQTQTVGVWGVHAVIGALEVHAYSEDVLKLTTNFNWEPYGELGIRTCDGTHVILVPGYEVIATVHLGGDGTPGINPCAGVSAVEALPATWGRIKRLYRTP